MPILRRAGDNYRFETAPLLVPGLVALGKLSLRAEVWVEVYDDEDPIFHVQRVERADTGEQVTEETFEEDDWIDLVNLLTELFCVAYHEPDAVTQLGELAD